MATARRSGSCRRAAARRSASATRHRKATMILNMPLTREEIEAKARALGEWFHNIDLGGISTAPNHFLGDYPRVKWNRFAHSIPADLSGKTVLDIGCNGGFYSIEMKRRGAARVVGIDFD